MGWVIFEFQNRKFLVSFFLAFRKFCKQLIYLESEILESELYKISQLSLQEPVIL